MIKELKNISLEDLQSLYTEGFEVYEKLDMYYFRVEITKVGAIATKGSTENVISDIDCVTNTMFKDICDFVDNAISPARTDIITEFGEIRIGFFYNPKTKYHVIDYNKYNKDLSGAFIISDIFFYSGKAEDIDIVSRKLLTYFKLYSTNNKIYNIPLCNVFEPGDEGLTRIKKAVEDYRKVYAFSNIEMQNRLCTALAPNGKSEYGTVGNGTASKLNIWNIEGLILKSLKKNLTYQIIINDTASKDVDKSTKLIYRDTVLQSFANILNGPGIDGIETVKGLIKDCDTYIDRVCKLFLFYIDRTNLFSKYSLDPEDLLPPHIGYMGNLDLDFIQDQNVKLLCSHNEVMKNILRLFLHTFSRNVSENKFSSFQEEDKKFLQEVTIMLKYKNYKQIMLTAYKANRNNE